MMDNPLFGIYPAAKGALALNEYADISETTALYPEEMALAYLNSGLSGEVGELYEITFLHSDPEYDQALREQRILEAGDVLWYLSQLSNKVLKIPFNVCVARNLMINPTNELPVYFDDFQQLCSYNKIDNGVGTPLIHGTAMAAHLMYLCSRTSEIVKKVIRDSDGRLADTKWDSYSSSVSQIAIILGQLMSWYKIRLSEVAHKNIDKLASRKQRGVLKDINRTEQH